jgi:hypothetical protein
MQVQADAFVQCPALTQVIYGDTVEDWAWNVPCENSGLTTVQCTDGIWEAKK